MSFHYPKLLQLLPVAGPSACNASVACGGDVSVGRPGLRRKAFYVLMHDLWLGGIRKKVAAESLR